MTEMCAARKSQSMYRVAWPTKHNRRPRTAYSSARVKELVGHSRLRLTSFDSMWRLTASASLQNDTTCAFRRTRETDKLQSCTLKVQSNICIFPRVLFPCAHCEGRCSCGHKGNAHLGTIARYLYLHVSIRRPLWYRICTSQQQPQFTGYFARWLLLLRSAATAVLSK